MAFDLYVIITKQTNSVLECYYLVSPTNADVNQPPRCWNLKYNIMCNLNHEQYLTISIHAFLIPNTFLRQNHTSFVFLNLVSLTEILFTCEYGHD